MNKRTKTTIKKEILAKLTKNFTISSVCHAVGIDRKTFYRWIDEDAFFKEQAYINIQECKKDITDMANARLVKQIDQGNLTAVMYWLNNKDPEINHKAITLTDDEVKELVDVFSSTDSIQQKQSLFTSYVLKGKLSIEIAEVIVKMHTLQMKVEDIELKKTEAEILNTVMHKKQANKERIKEANRMQKLRRR